MTEVVEKEYVAEMPEELEEGKPIADHLVQGGKLDQELLHIPRDVMEALSAGVHIADDAPKTAKAVVVLRSNGMSLRDIASQLKVSLSTVSYYLKKYDPKSAALEASDNRKLFLSAMFETIGMKALSQIKPEEIDKMSVKEKLYVASRCVEAVRMLGVTKKFQPQSTPDELFKKL